MRLEDGMLFMEPGDRVKVGLKEYVAEQADGRKCTECDLCGHGTFLYCLNFSCSKPGDLSNFVIFKNVNGSN